MALAQSKEQESMQISDTARKLITRKNLDHANKENFKFRAKPGLSEELIKHISKTKKEPKWMLDKRLASLKEFNKRSMPKWGPNLEDLDLNAIVYFGQPNAKKNATDWNDVPEDIKKTFEKLGIPEAERKSLAGVGAQYESEVIYHKLREDLEKQGVIFSDCDTALKEHEDMMKEYFMSTCVPINDHKFAALHGAVWSGGTFIYVPKGVKVDLPLQAYFRMNAENMGQFEHTLIIVDEGADVQYIEGCSAPQYTSNSLHAGCVEIFLKKNARCRYSSVENWSKNTYNLNTKRAIVEENAHMEWIGGNMGSGVTMLYPSSVLKGRYASADHLSIAFAGNRQNQDTGAKVFHLAPNTNSTVKAKSISVDGGITSYRGMLSVIKGATNSKASVVCDAIMIGEKSKTNTYPYVDIKENKVDVGHEATVGKIGNDQLFYLMSRGLSEEEAMKMIVSGFIEPITKALPLEYAVELNRLIELEMEGSIG